jgi:hypothetical protein
MEAFFDCGSAEIDHEPQLEAFQTKIRQHLDVENHVVKLNRLTLDNHLPINQ